MQVWTDSDFLSDLSCSMATPTKWPMHPGKTQISLGICPVWSQSSLSAWRKLGSLATHRAYNKDSDQTKQTLSALPFCWFCHAVAHFSSTCCRIYMLPITNILSLCEIQQFFRHSCYLLYSRSQVTRFKIKGRTFFTDLLLYTNESEHDTINNDLCVQQRLKSARASICPVWSESALSAWRRFGS